MLADKPTLPIRALNGSLVTSYVTGTPFLQTPAFRSPCSCLLPSVPMFFNSTRPKAAPSPSLRALALYTIPLLADTQNFMNRHRLNWQLRFPLPAPSQHNTIRRFSAAPQRYGPRGHQALDGALRYASPFTYIDTDHAVLQDVAFLACRTLSPTMVLSELRTSVLRLLSPFNPGSSPGPPVSFMLMTSKLTGAKLLPFQTPLPDILQGKSRNPPSRQG